MIWPKDKKWAKKEKQTNIYEQLMEMHQESVMDSMIRVYFTVTIFIV